MNNKKTIKLHVQDPSGQREVVANVPTEASWGETMNSIVENMMNLPQNTPTGEETVWTGRLEREGRHLHNSEIVGDALEPGDRVVLQPEVNAG